MKTLLAVLALSFTACGPMTEAEAAAEQAAAATPLMQEVSRPALQLVPMLQLQRVPLCDRAAVPGAPVRCQ